MIHSTEHHTKKNTLPAKGFPFEWSRRFSSKIAQSLGMFPQKGGNINVEIAIFFSGGKWNNEYWFGTMLADVSKSPR